MKLDTKKFTLDQIQSVNHEVNRSISYVPDKVQFGVSEDWRDARRTNKDDCDGFALTKYMMLHEKGVPDTCMAICSCITETGEGHAVLVVSTDKGDFVLDNRHSMIKPYETVPYKWLYVPENVTGDN